jgi:hypothetical protein
MTSAGAANAEIAAILQYVGDQLQRDENLRRELGSAVRRKDDSAMRKVAKLLWKGLRVAAPIAFSVFLAALGIPIS